MKRSQVQSLITARTNALMFIRRFELQIILAYLKIKKFRGLVSIFSFLGILIGVATLIVVTSVMNGFREELFQHIVGINGHVNIRNHQYTYDELIEILKPLHLIPEIKQITQTIEEQTIAISGKEAIGVMVKGIKYNDLLSEKQILKKIIVGSVEDFNEGIFIGSQIAANFNVTVNDYITFIAPENVSTLIGKIPRMKKYKIIGVFSFGMLEYDSSLVYMPFEMASKFFKSDDKPNNIDVYIKNANKSKEIASKITQLTGLPAVDWQTQQSAYFNALKVEKSIMFIILMMVILIAVFNIISSLFMLVDEKKQSIAILRTLGVTKFSIIKIFVLCGTLIGVFGSISGAVLGIFFTKNINNIKNILEKITDSKIFDPIIYYFENIPTVINYWEISIITMIAILLSFLGTIPAAYQASKQEPARILRY